MTDYIMDMDIWDASSHSYDMDCQPAKTALDQDRLSDPRCISIESDTTANTINAQGEYTNFFDDYDIYPTILGTGGYGTVRECLHRASGEKYAVKTIDKSKVERIDHIQREIALLSSIDHHGVMKMIDYYEDEDYVHIVTEKYTGGDLFDEIVKNTTNYGCLDEDQATRIIKSILEAVQYLHDNEIVHRDIKPENIMFEDEEGSSVKLIDFGLSRTHCSNKDGFMKNQVGTPYYMSPDVIQGKYDKSVDLWSIGVVCYILLTGYPPFNGDTNSDVLESVRKGNLVFDDAVWGNLSKASRHFVSMMLCMDPSSRIVTASDALQHPWIVNS